MGRGFTHWGGCMPVGYARRRGLTHYLPPLNPQMGDVKGRDPKGDVRARCRGSTCSPHPVGIQFNSCVLLSCEPVKRISVMEKQCVRC
jgi:hypothetical protein